MYRNKKYSAIIFAILAAALYAVSTPVSKVLLQSVPPTMVAAFLYLGAGVRMGALMLGRKLKHIPLKEEKLGRKEFPYTVAMIGLDIAAARNHSLTRAQSFCDRYPARPPSFPGKTGERNS